MAEDNLPDYHVKLPVDGVWHKLGAGWKTKREGKDTIVLILDVGTAITLQPGTKLVLVEPLSPREPNQN